MPLRSCVVCGGPSSNELDCYCAGCRYEVRERWRIANGMIGDCHSSLPWYESIRVPIDTKGVTVYTRFYLAQRGQRLANCRTCSYVALLNEGEDDCHRCQGKSKSSWEKAYTASKEVKRKNGYVHPMSDKDSLGGLSEAGLPLPSLFE